MKRTARVLFLALFASLVGAGSAFAQFMAADTLFVPAVAHSDGANDSHWRTDLTITNVDSTPVDVAIFFVPGGVGDNSGFVVNRDQGLGGTADDGFGDVNESLANIPPGGSVTLTDLVGQYWIPKLGAAASIGGLVIFSWESGTLDNEGNRTFRNITAYTRTYNATQIWVPDPDNEGQFIQKDATYGQNIPAVPWYNLADASVASPEKDLSFQLISGARDDDTFRFNLGLFNTSDPQTSIQLLIEPFDSTGERLLDENGQARAKVVRLGPFGQTQLFRTLRDDFGVTNVSDVLLRISFSFWSTTGTDPVPTFTSYGSLIDGRTNDPTTLLPSFAFPYDISSIWTIPDGGTTAAITRLGSPAKVRLRPIRMPRK